MPSYPGRLGSRTQTLLFGGINSEASIANIRDGEAADIVNWDLLPGGAIQVRNGFVNYQALGGTGRLMDHYIKYDGTEIYIAVSNGKLWSSSTPTGSWTDESPTPALVDSAKPWLGVNFGNNYYLANGDNPPIYFSPGSAAIPLKTQSLLPPPTSLLVTPVGMTTGTTVWKYAVTTVTGRGETTATKAFTVSGAPTLGPTAYNLITWTVEVGDNGGYNIYRFNDTDQAYELIGFALSQSGSYQDTGQAYLVPVKNPPLVNAAYNTPADWDVNGQPQGFGILSRGAGGRLVAWRSNTIWVSGLNNPLDWYGAGAFSFFLDGAEDNRIRASFAIYDFTVFTTSTNSFFVAGNSSSNLQVVKIQGTGCVSPHSAVQVGNDVYIWSQFGPTSLQRVLQGQDVQYSPIAEKIKSLLRTGSNVQQWPLIVGYNDVFARRVVWLYPGAGATSNTGALIFYYTTGGWTKYSNFNFTGAVTSADNTAIYALSTGGTIAQVGAGYTDNGASVTATYNGPWYDMGNWDMRRVIGMDLLTDATIGAYSFTINIAWDWGRSGYTESHTVTDLTMDGQTPFFTGSYANFYRIPTQGVGQSFQISFSVTSSVTPPKIVGWRVEGRAKGWRVS